MAKQQIDEFFSFRFSLGILIGKIGCPWRMAFFCCRICVKRFSSEKTLYVIYFLHLRLRYHLSPIFTFLRIADALGFGILLDRGMNDVKQGL